MVNIAVKLYFYLAQVLCIKAIVMLNPSTKDFHNHIPLNLKNAITKGFSIFIIFLLQSFKWLYCIIYILDPVENIRLDNSKAEYNPNDKITCSAQGMPGPSYIWQNLMANANVSGNVLTITQAMEGPNNWTCTAYNTIRGSQNEQELQHLFIVTSKLNPWSQKSFKIQMSFPRSWLQKDILESSSEEIILQGTKYLKYYSFQHLQWFAQNHSKCHLN